MLIYPATFEKDEKYILVRFPDIPEAVTQGETLEEAYEMAQEVLGIALEDKDVFPEASSLSDIQKQFPNAMVSLVGIDLIAYRRKYHSKSVRKNVTIPEWISNLAQSEGINFSQTLTEALKEKLGIV
ncbi:type II toxin-antitoxin system HicB family antitoxin [Tuanshanicoccus lijuaniae]|uniref:type II toxin-antitoxin system HicB family antitoxin n=1 Tax=Aerococcaceae bacterium zg-1292 TaxID=2774330 RepID=UPI001934BE23|nr:type II toxin-antitoxin system HicB family antitoxin [Aerococcaceae bacterium zg-1292]MBS4456700.1 type II toxin-antitoxin system HicB family antitoxin [Aerococcaceae bacterium zg-A91]MBS4458492.1 type II toxin-antitoxin system HicB family antitoxin [Aerococcaceae bacterium zg-BR33]QQA36541.1 type II toxin-antitoxin system HicB family antitoxin [Aerococcaceae bacterium zg-1292]